jgi:hypothetical protein
MLSALATVAVPAGAQQRPEPGIVSVVTDAPDSADRARAAAEGADGLRLVVSLSERRLWLRDGPIELFSAPVAVGKGTTLEHDGQRWDFATPRGRREVLDKAQNPIWVPPDWHYVELAREKGFALVRLERSEAVPLQDGSRVIVRGEGVGRLHPDGTFEVVPPGEEVVFGDTLFIPPLGTANRRISGELGRYKLDLGNGYLIHGTPHKKSIGTASTHGCIRLHGKDLAYLYAHVGVGTPVYIY